eukprot:7747126-Ditylum_brightwellii.AAC.1
MGLFTTQAYEKNDITLVYLSKKTTGVIVHNDHFYRFNIKPSLTGYPSANDLFLGANKIFDLHHFTKERDIGRPLMNHARFEGSILSANKLELEMRSLSRSSKMHNDCGITEPPGFSPRD